jgi:hypothetical protein
MRKISHCTQSIDMGWIFQQFLLRVLKESIEKDSRREIHTMVAVAAGARSSQTASSHQKARGSSAPLNFFSQNGNGAAAPATGGQDEEPT